MKKILFCFFKPSFDGAKLSGEPETADFFICFISYRLDFLNRQPRRQKLRKSAASADFRSFFMVLDILRKTHEGPAFGSTKQL